MNEFEFKIEGEHELSNSERRKFANALHRAILAKNWSAFEVYKTFFVCEGMATSKSLAKIEDACRRWDVDYKIDIRAVDEVKPQQTQNPTTKQINDSLIRAMENNLKNIQAHLRNGDFNAAVAELKLFFICFEALFRKEAA